MHVFESCYFLFQPDMGSQASLGLDVDRIQRKNDERMRRLQNLNNPGGKYWCGCHLKG